MASHRRFTLALAAAIFISPGPVRGQDVSGTWTTEVPIQVQNMNGVETVTESATVRITLEQDGETVVGTWQMAPQPDRPNPPARQLSGTVRGAQLVLTDTSEAHVRRGNEPPMAVRMVNTIDVTLDGDRLTGTQSARSIDGAISGQARPFTATRAQS